MRPLFQAATLPEGDLSPSFPDPVDALPPELVGMLMESLLHDARNPLNALSINLEVLSERMRRESGGAIPPQHEKNFKTMREQILRVDATLKQFADFIAPRAGQSEGLDLSTLVAQAMVVVGHEARKRRVQLRQIIDPGVKVRSPDVQALNSLVLQSLVRALHRSPQGAEVFVTLRAEGGHAVFQVQDASAEAGDATEALSRKCSLHQGHLQTHGGSLEIRLPQC